MSRILSIVLLVSICIHGQDVVIVSDKNFPFNTLKKDEIKAFFLNKRSLIKKQRVLVMNHEYGDDIRICFEKVILHKTKKSLERYWRKAYYQGYKPPKVIKSNSMLLSYLQHVSPAIGYIDSSKLQSKDVKVL